MNLTAWIIVAAVLVAVFALKRMSFVSADNARRFLQEGALLVDVRNPGEFNALMPECLNFLPRVERAQKAFRPCARVCGTRNAAFKEDCRHFQPRLRKQANDCSMKPLANS